MMPICQSKLYGKAAIETLAATYQQLYIAPGKGADEQYADIVKKGYEPENRDLSHFSTNEKDCLEYENTPVGMVLCITLHERSDFVTFLRIMANRCSMAEIPDTQGASILDGVINWQKIREHKKTFLEEAQQNGVQLPDWNAEFRRFTSDRRNYKDALIVFSIGPYSAIPASSLGLSNDEWITLSHIIRKYHECTHFICRRNYPEKIEPVWDELVADAVGIYAAFGEYSSNTEKLFLGIEGENYIGGRLENYVTVENEEEKQETLQKLSSKISKTLNHFDEIISENKGIAPFELTIKLEKTMDDLWIPSS